MRFITARQCCSRRLLLILVFIFRAVLAVIQFFVNLCWVFWFLSFFFFFDYTLRIHFDSDPAEVAVLRSCMRFPVLLPKKGSNSATSFPFRSRRRWRCERLAGAILKRRSADSRASDSWTKSSQYGRTLPIRCDRSWTALDSALPNERSPPPNEVIFRSFSWTHTHTPIKTNKSRDLLFWLIFWRLEHAPLVQTKFIRKLTRIASFFGNRSSSCLTNGASP